MSFIIAANWKMNKNPRDCREFFNEFKNTSDHKVIFFVPAVNLTTTAECLKDSQIGWGPQNIYHEASGAFTGENSPQVMADIGAPYGLVGHSERRTLFAETNEETCLKVKAYQEYGISPMLCIGETIEERNAGKTLEVLQKQLDQGLQDVSIKKELHVAYEPVWAIGTGEVATIDQVNEAHNYIRLRLSQLYPEDSNKIQILYGGSVKPGNADELSQVHEVGGFLVGGASLKVDSFTQIIEASRP